MVFTVFSLKSIADVSGADIVYLPGSTQGFKNTDSFFPLCALCRQEIDGKQQENQNRAGFL
jgi:hypothetical protein